MRCEGEEVPVDPKESNLIGASPGFIPGNIDVVDDLAGLYRVGARVREHRVMERYSLIRRWIGARLHHPAARAAPFLAEALARAVAAVPYASDGRTRPRELGRQFADPLSSNGLCQEIVEPCEHAHDPFGG
jgi:hypothetical protein